MNREMAFHLEAATQEYIAQGLSPEEARRRALADFGALELAKDEMRDLHPLQRLEQMWRDIRYAARQLRHAPAFAAAVILTLAGAIGANTAIFSVVRAVLLQPLPYPDANRLACLWHDDRPGMAWYTFSYPRFLFFEEHLRDVADAAAYDDESATVLMNGAPVRVEGGRVSWNFFSVLGVAPALGRSFTAAEDRHGAAPVALLSDQFWKERFSADPRVIGRPVTVDGEAFTIIGVMPPQFQFQGVPVDVWRSRIVDTRTFPPASVQLGASYLTVVARLRPGVTMAQLRAKLALLGGQYRAANPGNTDLAAPVQADLLQTKIFAGVHVTLLVLWGAVACLLAIACANVANLVLARAVARERELHVRVALGAGRLRIAQQLILENLFLSAGSILLALPLGIWGTRELVRELRATSQAVPDVHPDTGVMLFLIAVAVAVGIVLGLLPLALVRRSGIHSSERGSSGSWWKARMRSGIGAAQIAFCIVLLAAAGLLAESFLRMNTMQSGIRTEHVMVFPLDLMPDRYESPARRVTFYDEAIRRAASIPGVTQTAIASRVDFVAGGNPYKVQPEGQADLGPRNPMAEGRSVSPDYFRLLGVPLLSGRYFDERDTAASKRVAIVNEAFARKYFPGADAIGKHLIYSTQRTGCEIVGVAGDVRSGVTSVAPDDQFYLPLAQRPLLVASLLIRTSTTAGFAATLRERMQSIDAQQAVAETSTLDRMIERRMGRPRTVTKVVSGFALSALLLAAVGVYGVVAYSVAQRQKEIGIRVALGATPATVRALVFRQTLRILALGLLAGVPGSLALSRLYASVLFAVTPSDPLALSGAVTILVAVAALATWLPARRAAQLDPIIALRND